MVRARATPAADRRTGVRATSHGRRHNDRPRRLLLVDDDSELRDLLVRHLVRAGFVVRECVSGFELTAALAAEAAPLDLVIADSHLPGLTPGELVARLRTEPHAPAVVFLTASGDTDPHLALRAHAAVRTLAKPFAPAELVLTVQLMLDSR